MAERTLKTKKRRLRLPSTNQKQADKNGKQSAPHRIGRWLSAPFRFLGHLPIWKPFKFIGRFIVPPYFRKSWQELRQVEWPNGKQTRQLTGAVILFSLVFGILIAAFDFVLDKLFKEVLLR